MAARNLSQQTDSLLARIIRPGVGCVEPARAMVRRRSQGKRLNCDSVLPALKAAGDDAPWTCASLTHPTRNNPLIPGRVEGGQALAAGDLAARLQRDLYKPGTAAAFKMGKRQINVTTGCWQIVFDQCQFCQVFQIVARSPIVAKI